MKSDRAFHHARAVGKGGIEEMCVEIEIDGRVEYRHQTGKGIAAQQLVCGADIGESAATEVLQLKQLSDEKVPIIHKRGKLGGMLAQLLHNSRSIHDLRVVDIGNQFCQVVRAKGHVAFTECN